MGDPPFRSRSPEGPRIDTVWETPLGVGLVRVDALQTVEELNGVLLEWIGLSRAAVIGQPFGTLFDASSEAEANEVAGRGFLWASERRFLLRGGRRISLVAQPAEQGTGAWTLVVIDDSSASLLETAMEHQRQADAVATIASAISRELNDPMSIVQGRLELLLALSQADSEVVRRHVEVAVEHARRMSATLRNLRLVGRGALPRLEPVAMREAIDEALALLGARRDEVTVELLPPDLEVGADPAVLARVLASVLRRSFASAPRHGGVLLRAQRSPTHVEVLVAPRVAEGALRAGQDDDPAEIAVERALLGSLGGVLQLRSASATSLILQSPPHVRARPRPTTERLLAVGGQWLPRTLAEILDREGFSVSHAETPEQALAMLDASEEDGEAIDGIVTELFLPGVSGLGLAREIVARRPSMLGRIVLVTEVPVSVPPRVVSVVQRPLSRDALLQALGRRVRRSYNTPR